MHPPRSGCCPLDPAHVQILCCGLRGPVRLGAVRSCAKRPSYICQASFASLPSPCFCGAAAAFRCLSPACHPYFSNFSFLCPMCLPSTFFPDGPPPLFLASDGGLATLYLSHFCVTRFLHVGEGADVSALHHRAFMLREVCQPGNDSSPDPIPCCESPHSQTCWSHRIQVAI